MLSVPSATQVLGAMITPALLISAAGTLTLSTSHRLGRVVDRVRVLGDLAAQLLEENEVSADEFERRELYANQLRQLTKRIRKLQTAMTMLYASIGLLVATSLSIGLVQALGSWLEWLPLVLGFGGAASLFYSSILLVFEARLAVTSTLDEMAYVGKLVARKTKRILKN